MLKLADPHGARLFLLGLVLGIAPLACASVTFPYHFYNLAPTSYDGKLLGPDVTQDLDLSVCKPDAVSQGKCVVMLADAYFQLKLDYLDTKQSLIDCQKGQQFSQ